MKEIEPQAYASVALLLGQIEHHTLLCTLLSGQTRGKIYTDRPEGPTLAFAQFRHRAYLCGSAPAELKEPLKDFFLGTVVANCREAEVPLFRLTVSDPAWLDLLAEALTDHPPLRVGYQCYRMELEKPLPAPVLPEGFVLQEVTRELIESDFSGRDALLEEMCSERESVDAFLAQSFGVVAFKGAALAGWCLSEYNHENRCEVGIAALPSFQRRGLAKAMTAAFLGLAQRQEIQTVLWHCYRSNQPSAKTALSAGFQLAVDEAVLLVYLDPAVNYAVHGNHNFEAGDFTQAMGWYQKALACDHSQVWIAWNAACTAAYLGDMELAFKTLEKALALGFDDRERLIQSPHLTPLHTDVRWAKLLGKLAKNKTTA